MGKTHTGSVKIKQSCGFEPLSTDPGTWGVLSEYLTSVATMIISLNKVSLLGGNSSALEGKKRAFMCHRHTALTAIAGSRMVASGVSVSVP